MLADVTNRARGARGFQLIDGTTHLVEPGASTRLDLADHPLHGVWEAAGEVSIRSVANVPLQNPADSGAAPAGEASPEAHVPSRRKPPSGGSRHPLRGDER